MGLLDIIRKFLPQGEHLIPPAPYYHRDYYEQILKDSGRVLFMHNVSNKNSDYAFSKMQILKIISTRDWEKENFSLHMPKRLQRCIGSPWYNYFDYVRVWDQVLFYQNCKFLHS